ncbi:LacI family transcriptional regulator [Mobiluncus mulieris]|uniref:Degradation activator n=1 Tax=Mobiluncus mulieris TaxID=2052 RepID=A0A8G2M5E9_9ACTO|nr:LacI family DNA-binding transcriptional regulator [Mobiluncus mulieris]MBB5847158.1 DNA-binding LacI/PurR family transcriptional regulator [Mobiluncus mulieris]MCU9970596.1 LacI family transcriptional regulator [Mobiluncus mulieris]MCU9995850.1 LacI family transcriptional regulator [Mobiluncus mulieris]MCV0011106.1 LacI family transcriptional regulator [Mobiluncus mulieris]NMW60406.1 LacI family transcriptional regulator [Mobiluncus mulieris]
MRQITQTDVAKAAGVSRGLVSLALSGSNRVAPDTAERIKKIAKELGYSRNFTAAMLASSRSTLVGMILPNLRNPYFESLVCAYQNEADNRGLVTLAATASPESGRLDKLLDQFEQMRVKGIILVTPYCPAQHFEDLAVKYPVVAVGVPSMGEYISAVHIDEYEAAELISSHALSRGIGRINYVADSGADSASQYRLEAIKAATKDCGIDLIIKSHDSYLRRRLNIERGECYLVQNDLIAIDVISAIKAAGMMPGSDICVISYDNTYLADHPQFELTSIDQNPQRQAELSFKILDGSPGAATECIVTPRLMVRDSSRVNS